MLLALVGLAGCASVPDSSPVQVLRQVGEGEDAQLPPGPVEGSNPLDLVRDFVFASGSSAAEHGSARRFLAPDAVEWDDAASITVSPAARTRLRPNRSASAPASKSSAATATR